LEKQTQALLHFVVVFGGTAAGEMSNVKDGSVGINRSGAATKVVCFVVVLLGLSEMSFNAV